MATLQAVSLLLTILSIHVCTTLAANSALNLKIVHPQTIKDHGDDFFNSSISRLIYLVAKTAEGGGNADLDAHTGLVTDEVYSFAYFFVNFLIGDPPVLQLAAMDTSSDLTWVECLVAFNATNSRTYAPFPCSDQVEVPCTICSTSNECMTELPYVDGSIIGAVIAEDRFTFSYPDGNDTFYDNVVFGCAKEFSPGKYKPGLFGLGSQRNELSTVQKMGGIFSYCVGRIYDKQYNYSQLFIGEGTKTEGTATSLENKNGLYYVDFDGISFDDTRLDIDPSVFARNGGVVIDTGSIFSWFISAAFDLIYDEVAKHADKLELIQYELFQPWELCFYGNRTKYLYDFPYMIFHLTNETDFYLDAESLFYQRSRNIFCMGIGPSNQSDQDYLSIIGMMAQQNYNVAYDLGRRKLFVHKMDCRDLDGEE